MSAELEETYDGNPPMPKNDEVYEAVRECLPHRKYGILPIAAIYGKNASGKSNLINTLHDVSDDILDKTVARASLLSSHSPFQKIVNDRQFNLCPPEKRNDRLQYHICMVIGNTEYTLSYALVPEGIEEEELTRHCLEPNNSPELLYKRYNFQEYEPLKESTMAKHISLMKESNEKRLWFSRIAPAHTGLQHVYQWFQYGYESTRMIKHPARSEVFSVLAEMIETDKSERMKNWHKQLLLFLRCLDSSIIDIRSSKRGEYYALEIYHNTIDEENVPLGIEFESEGTRKLIVEFVRIYNSLVINGKPYVYDELDSALHPIAFWQIVRMFNDPKINIKNAQLIFTAHDTIALDSNILRRDQVHIVDKNEYSVSTVKRLSEMEHVQKYSAMEYEFRSGYYGSFPEKFNQSFEPIGEDK